LEKSIAYKVASLIFSRLLSPRGVINQLFDFPHSAKGINSFYILRADASDKPTKIRYKGGSLLEPPQEAVSYSVALGDSYGFETATETMG
jgi:hypothetical protein